MDSYTASDITRILSFKNTSNVRARAEIHLVEAIEGKPFPINRLECGSLSVAAAHTGTQKCMCHRP
jgi:hypothetical protein